MLKVNYTLVLTVSALALSAGNVSASFSKPPLASVLCTKLHTSYNSHMMQSSAPARQVAESRLLVDRDLNALLGNVPNDSISDEQTKKTRMASVCFITDTGACSGNSFGGGAHIEDGGHGTPGGSGGNSGTNDDGKTPDYNLDNDERCKKEGYNQTGACPAEQTPNKVCPYNTSYHDKCVCRSDLKTCTKPEYGVGNACGGKYLSCQRDDAKACNEDGYTLSAACSSTQQKDGLCPYNNAYYKQCVCRSDLVSCSSPKIGVGTACDGKYMSCTCPSSYTTCSCGGYNACTVNGTTKYSSCKSCSSGSGTSSDYERELWVNSANPEDGSFCAYSYIQKECEFNCRGTNYYLKYEKKVYGLSCNTFGDFDVYKCICN